MPEADLPPNRRADQVAVAPAMEAISRLGAAVSPGAAAAGGGPASIATVPGCRVRPGRRRSSPRRRLLRRLLSRRLMGGCRRRRWTSCRCRRRRSGWRRRRGRGRWVRWVCRYGCGRWIVRGRLGRLRRRRGDRARRLPRVLPKSTGIWAMAIPSRALRQVRFIIRRWGWRRPRIVDTSICGLRMVSPAMRTP